MNIFKKGAVFAPEGELPTTVYIFLENQEESYYETCIWFKFYTTRDEKDINYPAPVASGHLGQIEKVAK